MYYYKKIINFKKCSDNILSWDNYLYNDSITTNFKVLLNKHKHVFEQHESVSETIHKALNARNTYEFDENFTRRIHNF